MLQSLRPPPFDVRWSRHLLAALPAHTVADMRRCAAAALAAAQATPRGHRDAIRSFHTSPGAAVRRRPSSFLCSPP